MKPQNTVSQPTNPAAAPATSSGAAAAPSPAPNPPLSSQPSVGGGGGEGGIPGSSPTGGGGQPSPRPIVFVDMKVRAGGKAGDDTLATNPAPSSNDKFFEKVEESLRSMLNSNEKQNERLTHADGKLSSQQSSPEQLVPARDLRPDEKTLAAVFGILESEATTNPEVQVFGSELVKALSEYTENKSLFNKVLEVLISNGVVKVLRRSQHGLQPVLVEVEERQLSAELWAKVVRRIQDLGIPYNDADIEKIALGILVGLRSSDDANNPSAIEIVLPELEDSATVEIIPENLHALQAVYFASMLEEMKLFQVVDKLIDMFQQGMLPVGRGRAGDFLYRYWKRSIDRLTEIERRNLYVRAFGFPGGDPSVPANREFNDLWLRFISAVSSYARQDTLEQLLTRKIPGSVSLETVRRSGRDLAANLSLHGYGIAYFAATELQTQLNEAVTLLSDTEIKSAFGARDMFQVIDQVATLELGGARNSIRYRTLADSGAIIIRWLANRRMELASSRGVAMFDRKQDSTLLHSPKPKVSPTDFDLISACEQWLAVTGTPEQKVEEYAEPSEPPMMTSRPIQIPSVAKDLLDSAGISLGMNAPTRRNGRQTYATK